MGGGELVSGAISRCRYHIAPALQAGFLQTTANDGVRPETSERSFKCLTLVGRKGGGLECPSRAHKCQEIIHINLSQEALLKPL